MTPRTMVLCASLSVVACQKHGANEIATKRDPSVDAKTVSVLATAAPSDAAVTIDAAGTTKWDLAKIANLSRVTRLTDAHRDLLARQGFFLAPQLPPNPKKKGDSPATATHLFHVYERNDYQRFPSFITVDLAIDTTHTYFEAVLRDIEEHQLATVLRGGISALLHETDKLRAAAKSDAGRAAAIRTETFWAIGLRLLDPSAALPKPVRTDAAKVAAAAESASGQLPGDVLKSDVDLGQMRPRGHYTRNPALERYFRAMSWMGLAAFPIEGPHEDTAAIALLARAYLASDAGKKALARVLDLTAFFVGGANAAGLDQAAAILSRAVPGAAEMTADQLTGPEAVTHFRTELALGIPKLKIAGDAREIRILGRRAFEDAAALQALIPPLQALATPENAPDLIPRAMGARAAAAILGSADARTVLLDGLAPAAQSALGPGIELARTTMSALTPDRWSVDAYHGTLQALRALFDPPSAKTPPLLATAARRLRAVQAFAAGWAELRHDTILYGEQLGAECDAEAMEPPPSWVEPVPEVYRHLAAMVRALETRLTAAGLDLNLKLERGEKTGDEDPDGRPDPAEFYKPPAEKTKLMLGFLDFLAETADLELEGRTFNRKRLDRLTTLGGEVEWILMTMSNSDVLNERDSDMAVVADVFSWRPSAQALEVAVAHPDLIFAIIPTRKGSVLARGAVMSYREFMESGSDRLTDEAWRARLQDGSAPSRPTWTDSLYGAPVGPIAPPKQFQYRCGPMSGSRIEDL